MKRLHVFLLFLGLSSLAIAETMDKEEFIDTIAKFQACVDAGHMAEKSVVEKALGMRVVDYANAHFTKAELDEIGVIAKMRSKTAIVVGGLGCETAFKKLMSLPVKPKN